MTAQILTQKRLKELLHYCPDSGIFTWKYRDRKYFNSDNSRSTWNTRYSGSHAGCVQKKGRTKYIIIGVFGKLIPGHRLAWLYLHGTFPSNQIDHIDGNGLNNIASNLRDVTSGENSRNCKMPINNKSGCPGVHWGTRDNRWYSRIGVAGETKYLGSFTNKHKAIAVRKAAEVCFNYHPNHGRR